MHRLRRDADAVGHRRDGDVDRGTQGVDTEVRGKRVIVMGLGRFGGGIGVTRWLVGQGASVLVTDLASEAELHESVEQLRGLPITFRLSRHDPADLETCDLLVVSPAVDKANSSYFQAAIARRVPWTSEMNLFLAQCPARIVGVTGSAGKSTTTAMIGAILERGIAGRRVFVGGNIGRSLLEELHAMRPDDLVVLELSSFQLEDAAAVARSPNVAVITNLRPNHLDRHGTLDAYADAKLNIARFQTPEDVLFVHCDEIDLRARLDRLRPRSRVIEFGDPAALEAVARVLRVPGHHNRINASAALAVVRYFGMPDAAALDALREFRGLPHRLEFVREVGGVGYYNDSKSTTPDSARIALEAFDVPVILLLGGSDKHVPFDGLADAVARRARAAICYGAVRDKIAGAICELSGGSSPMVERVNDLPAAIEVARRQARAGDVVVLSPACASYDQFRNYEQRGELFRQIVRGWL
jgi:UDP-N-acetylmuramoylalanine--D-glutamate ligase